MKSKKTGTIAKIQKRFLKILHICVKSKQQYQQQKNKENCGENEIMTKQNENIKNLRHII